MLLVFLGPVIALDDNVVVSVLACSLGSNATANIALALGLFLLALRTDLEVIISNHCRYELNDWLSTICKSWLISP